MTAPEVSVVMGVYNGAQYLHETVDSVLAQEEVEFEFVIVNDGSVDASASILDEYAARDDRVIVVHQENRGLTHALIRGCELARGTYIARQDCGDVSLRRRLSKQVAHIRESPERALVSCTTTFVAPRGEFLYESGGKVDDEDVRRSLLHDDVSSVRGISHHGTAMFARTSYREAGGYRREFTVAQDLDLWIRLARKGKISFVQETLYRARMTPDSITAVARPGQLRTAELILKVRDAESRGSDTKELLTLTTHVARPARRNSASGNYFIGRMLQKNGNTAAAAEYLRDAVKVNPLLLKGWLALLLARTR